MTEECNPPTDHQLGSTTLLRYANCCALQLPAGQLLWQSTVPDVPTADPSFTRHQLFVCKDTGRACSTAPRVFTAGSLYCLHCCVGHTRVS
jgi:hypothetical protein